MKIRKIVKKKVMKMMMQEKVNHKNPKPDKICKDKKETYRIKMMVIKNQMWLKERVNQMKRVIIV